MTNRTFGSKEDQGWAPSQDLCILSNQLLMSTDCQEYTAFMNKKIYMHAAAYQYSDTSKFTWM